MINLELNGETLELDEEALELAKEFCDISGSNPFKNGRVVYITNDEQFAVVKISDKYGNKKFIPTVYSQLRKLEAECSEIFKEKRKIEKMDFTAVSGMLPQSEIMFCLGAYAEGNLTNKSLTNPSYEGGQVFILGVRSTNIDFALGKKVIPNVGIPTTLFVVRTQKILKAREYATSLEDDNFEMFEVKSVHAACVQGRGRINHDTKIYHYPFTNVNRTLFGRVCLGQVYGTSILQFESSADLDRFPTEFFDSMADTHDYNTRYASNTELKLESFLKTLQNKPFPSETELIYSGWTYGEWLAGVFNDLYK